MVKDNFIYACVKNGSNPECYQKQNKKKKNNKKQLRHYMVPTSKMVDIFLAFQIRKYWYVSVLLADI